MIYGLIMCNLSFWFSLSSSVAVFLHFIGKLCCSRSRSSVLNPITHGGPNWPKMFLSIFHCHCWLKIWLKIFWNFFRGYPPWGDSMEGLSNKCPPMTVFTLHFLAAKQAYHPVIWQTHWFTISYCQAQLQLQLSWKVRWLYSQFFQTTRQTCK